ncbi:VWA domain-containing protein [Piscibacillus salipiscarius]|nr:VWA domain-containing protein [Piscibacillus salipiscarius]
MKLKPLYVLLIVLFISGCSNSDSTKPHPEDSDPEIENETVTTSDQDQEESNETEDVKESQDEEPEITLEELDPIPTNVEGLASQSPGRFANADSIYDLDQEIKEAMQDVGPMSKNPTDEEYERFLRKMYWLVAQDYPNPEDVIKKWEFASFGNPDLPDTKFHFKENYNVEVILDSSGSMANPAGNGTRMDVAKKSIKEFLSEVPEEANVSLRVYGHKGTGADSDKEMSCNAIEQVYGFNIYNEDKFKKSLNQFKPMGWTPLADALKQSQEALSQFDAKKNTN